MNSHLRWALALTMLPIAACSSGQPQVASAPPAPPAADIDQMFVNAAADTTEVDAGQLSERARNTRIRQYAAKVISDHAKAAQQLTTLAQSKGLTITPNTADSAILAHLQADKPGVFDRDYMRQQVASQQAAVQLFQDEAANGQDPDLKAFAQQTLPTVQQHLTMARQISGIRAPAAPRAPAKKASTAQGSNGGFPRR